MTVIVNTHNGMRYGSFNIHGIKGNFPLQAITSTNLNHAKEFEKSDFDFKTNIVEIVEFKPKKLLSDSSYREKRRKIVSEIIEQNPDKLFLFTLKGARATSYKTKSGVKVPPFKFTRSTNESLIDFQIESGFKLIKAFFKNLRNAKDLQYFRSKIPKECSFVAALDENLSHATFRKLYLECYAKKDEIIAFFGRKLGKKNSKKIHNRLNFEFISHRKDDQIIRLTSFAPKSINGVVSSLVYNFFRLDVYSFMTRRGNQDIPDFELKALNGFIYEILQKDTKLICPITGKNLYASSKEFKAKLGKSSLPVSVHDIVRLNEIFAILHEKYSRKQIEELLKQFNVFD